MLDRFGIIKTTLIDYPGRVATTLFTHGCPFRCPYCHNPELIDGPVPDDFVTRDDVLRHLDRRRSVLSGVCITGGEPLVHGDLGGLCAAIHERGLSVKLDTSGAYPDRLRDLLDQGLVDYVAMDIKTSFDRYDTVHGDGDAVRRSMRLIQSAAVEHEFRTTVAPGIVTSEDIDSIADALTPGDRYVLAQFRPATVFAPEYRDVTPYPVSVLVEWQTRLTDRGLQCELRGVL
jgi:pyruvate formate lyase activating enzyme